MDLDDEFGDVRGGVRNIREGWNGKRSKRNGIGDAENQARMDARFLVVEFNSMKSTGCTNCSWNGWVDFCVFHCLPNSACLLTDWGEVVGPLGKIVEHPNQSQPNLGPRADGTPCT